MARRFIPSVISVLVATSSLVVVHPPAWAAASTTQATDEPVVTGTFVPPPIKDSPSDVTDPEWIAPEVSVPSAASAEVEVPSTGWARVGSLPVSVARSANGVGVSRVRIRMLEQSEVEAAGGRLLGFELSRADGRSAAGAVAMTIDYSGIAKAYGGDFGSRLRLVRVADCAACARPTVRATNMSRASQLRALNVAVRPDPSTEPGPALDSGFGPQSADSQSSTLLAPSTTTYTTMAMAGGANGDYAASALTPTDSWTVGIGSGAFTYSYPVDVPPAVAGPAPSLAFNYSSQAVDGRTSSSNGQVSKVGEGWSFETGFVERKFHSCRDENIARDDLCWSADNEYFLNFMGRSGEIVRTGPSSNEWRLRGNDPGWRILSYKACCANGDNDGEYFVVITPDGTKYWFGYGYEPRHTETRYTSSALTVPVYGGSGEPCYSAVSTASWCQQAYRWNVDRILDTNENVTSLFYTAETNRYSRHGNTALPTIYDRSAYLKQIEYGKRHNAEDGRAYAIVRVDTMDRCVTQVACPTPTASSAQTSYPDVPLDRMCTSSVACAADQTSPTFWSTKEISKVETEFWNQEVSPSAYEPVSTYRLTYSFPPTTDGTSPSLWLKDITRTGEYGVGSTPLPGLRLGGIAKANRVNHEAAGVPPMYKYRIDTVTTDLGAQIRLTYGTPDPCPSNTGVAWDTNPYDCFPAWYVAEDGSAGWVAFHKYLVTEAITADMSAGQPSRTATYTYVGSPAWHYADSVLAASGSQSWNDYRGYEDVRVKVTGGGASEGTDTRYLVFRGMYGDKLLGGGSKTTEVVTDSLGADLYDYDYRAGQTLEVKNYDATDGHFASTIYRYWSYQTIDGPNGFQSHDSDYVRASQVIGRTKNLDTGSWRTHQVDRTYSDATGMPTETSDEQMPGTASDDTCTKLGYTENTTTGTSGGTTHWIIDAPYRSVTYGGYCGSGVPTIISDTRFDYDAQTYATAPTRGNVTETRVYSDATTIATTRFAFDDLGRPTATTSPNEVAAGTNGSTTTTYSPALGYPYNGIKTTNVLGRASTTVLYSAFGTPRRVTDANGDVTSIFIDHLGRTSAVSRPGEPTGAQSLSFAYDVEAGHTNKVTTVRLISDGSSVTSHEFFDGLGRSVQRHLPPISGGTGRRLVTTRYDELGQKAAESQPFYGTGTSGAGLATVALTGIPLETRFGFDSAGRVYAASQYAFGVRQYSTQTDYHGWHHVVDAPVRANTEYHTDVAGRVTKVVDRPTTATSITTNYAYTAFGDIATITDNANNVTTYSYDRLRRRTSSTDPDQGTWLMTYTLEGDVKTVRDAIFQSSTNTYDTVEYVYDRLRRKTGVYAGSASSGTRLATWTYDTAPGGFPAVLNAVGRQTAATRHVGSADYTTRITEYDNRGRVIKKAWDIPASAGALAGTYNYQFGYNLADDAISVAMPAVGDVAAGGLPAETVTTSLNSVGLPDSLTSTVSPAAPYIAATTYQANGRLAGRELVGGVQQSYTYDAVAGRLATTKAIADIDVAGTATAKTIEDRTYAYDDDSNVTSITDAVAPGSVTQRECFAYDPLNRLTSAFTTTSSCTSAVVPGPDPYDLGYIYDSLGNITSARNGSTTSDYAYAGSGHAHAPKTVGTATYLYDANGATTKRPTAGGDQTLVWNKLHQLESVSGPGAAAFVYDADGARLLRTSATGATLYLDDMDVTAVPSSGGGSTVTGKRYYGGVAMRTGGTIMALVRNHQDSTTAAYDVAAKAVAYQRYTPFGARRGNIALVATERRFLDSTEDPTGLSAVGARYYDANIGRFVSVDPVTEPQRPQTLAAYSYALNNPVTLSDPSGLLLDKESGGGPGCEEGCEPAVEPYFVDCTSYGSGTCSAEDEQRSIAEFVQAGGSRTHPVSVPRVVFPQTCPSCGLLRAMEIANNVLIIGEASVGIYRIFKQIQGLRAAASAAAEVEAKNELLRASSKSGREFERQVISDLGLEKNTVKFTGVSGKDRIFDGYLVKMNGRDPVEIKKVAVQALTRQIKDEVAEAKRTGDTLLLIISPGTRVTRPVENAVLNGDIGLATFVGAR
jgi:RHS repeat-associated protein